MLITILVFYRVIECLPLNSSETIISRLVISWYRLANLNHTIAPFFKIKKEIRR